MSDHEEDDLESTVELRRSKGLTRTSKLSWSRNAAYLNASIDDGLNRDRDSFHSKRLSLSRMDSIADDDLKSKSFWENRRSGDFTFRQNSVSSEGGNDTRMRSSIIVTTAESTENLAPEKKTSTFRRFLGFRKTKDDEPKAKTNEVYVDICHSGVLIEPGKDRTEWRVTLDKEFLRWISDKGRNAVGVQNVTSVTASNSFDAACPHGFEVTYHSEKSDHVQVFATRTEDERAVWMQMVLEVAVVEPFPRSLTREFARAGVGSVKEGTAGAWVSTWLLLRERELFYCVQAGNLLALDLRKARTVVTQSSGGSLEVHVDVQERSLWLRSPGEGDTRRWGHCLHAAALDNGPTLETQQLTRDDVPVIVDKCIDFINNQGMLCAGVYGHVSSSAAVSQLLSEFRLRDAWRLVLGARSGLDVAAALARFFAELERPLLPDLLARQLLGVAYSKCHDGVKVDRYRALLKELPRVHHVTSRRLLGHLHFLQRSSNSRVDLAAAWGPCLMRQSEGLNEAGMTSILHGLISLYPRVYDVTEEEIAREMRMLQAVQQIQDAACDVPDSIKHVSDLLVWVYLDSYNSGETVQVAVGPQTTSRDICTVFHGLSDIMLQEFVLGGSLCRPLHPLERVMDVVLRWGDWDEADRRDNQLVLAPCIFYAEIRAMGKARARTIGELKFADAGSRHFATYEFELSQTSLSFARDKKSPKLGEWRVNDLVWYLGHEPKREPLSKWSITFISKENKPNRTREQPYFGCALGGSSKKELLHWCAGLLLAQFPGML